MLASLSLSLLTGYTNAHRHTHSPPPPPPQKKKKKKKKLRTHIHTHHTQTQGRAMNAIIIYFMRIRHIIMLLIFDRYNYTNSVSATTTPGKMLSLFFVFLFFVFATNVIQGCCPSTLPLPGCLRVLCLGV